MMFAIVDKKINISISISIDRNTIYNIIEI